MITVQNFPGKDLINHSYERIIRFVSSHIDRTDIINILEFGPGYSTCLLVELYPNAFIKTIESVESWYIYGKDLLNGYKNIEFKFVQEDEYKQFVVEELNKKYDFIFIDGVKRPFCFNQSAAVKPKIIVLHDAEWFEKEIAGGVKLFKHKVSDGVGFNKQHNLGCKTLAVSDVYNFQEWYQVDLLANKISNYNEI